MGFSLRSVLERVTGPATPTKVVGIDIGSSSIKVVELEQTDRAVTLRTYGELQLGPYADRQLGEIAVLSEEKKIEALVDVIREAGVSATAGVLAMPLSASFVTVVPIVTKDSDTIEAQIPVTARKYIPVPLTDVILDWTELPAHSTGNDSVTEVLLAAVQTESMASFNTILRAVKMASQPAEIEPFSVIRALEASEKTTTAIIDMGAQMTKLYIVRDGVLERIHRVSVGGASVTKKTAQLIEEDFETAENIKRNYTEHAAEVQKATAATLTAPIQEFKRIIDQYQSRLGSELGQVVLSGGVAQSAPAQAVVRDTLGREVVIARAFDRIAYPAFMEDTLNSIGPTFAVSLGAALRVFE